MPHVPTKLACAAAVLGVAALAGCGNNVPSGSVAKVGDEEITKEEFDKWLKSASQGAAAFVAHAVEAVEAADRTLAGLQDSMLPVEAGDEQLRTGLKAVREPLGSLPGKAREFLRGLGR